MTKNWSLSMLRQITLHKVCHLEVCAHQTSSTVELYCFLQSCLWNASSYMQKKVEISLSLYKLVTFSTKITVLGLLTIVPAFFIREACGHLPKICPKRTKSWSTSEDKNHSPNLYARTICLKSKCGMKRLGGTCYWKGPPQQTAITQRTHGQSEKESLKLM